MNYSYIGPQRWRSRLPRHSLKLIIAVAVSAVVAFYWFWETHIELAFYSRNWVSQEILEVRPLAGCFNPARISATQYNLTRARAPKYNDVHAGMPMRLGRDCYDFAGTVQREPDASALTAERTIFHSYWRTDLAPFGPRQEWLLKSFFATQDVAHARLVLWSNGDLSRNPDISKWIRRYPGTFETRIVDMKELARDTALDGSSLLQINDEKAWVDGDVVRLLVLWAFGGVWIDMDSLLTRDLAPLLEHEFVTQWDCYDKIYQPLNGAAMHFLQHSPYLCEAFELMARSPPPRRGSTDWGSLLYHKLWRGLVAGGIQPFKILPFCFTDGRSCRVDTRLPDPFVTDVARGGVGPGTIWGAGGAMEGGGLDTALSNVFAVHLHNQWEKDFPAGGWVDRLLLRRYDAKLGVESIEERAAAVMPDRRFSRDDV